MNLFRLICYSGSFIFTSAREFEKLVNEILIDLKGKKPDIQWDVTSAGNTNILSTFHATISSSHNDSGNWRVKIFIESVGLAPKLSSNLKNFLDSLIDKNPKITSKLTSAGHDGNLKAYLVVFVEYLDIKTQHPE